MRGLSNRNFSDLDEAGGISLDTIGGSSKKGGAATRAGGVVHHGSGSKGRSSAAIRGRHISMEQLMIERRVSGVVEQRYSTPEEDPAMKEAARLLENISKRTAAGGAGAASP